MEPEEVAELVECWECGATVSPSEDAVYLFGDEQVLCLECSIKRGGEYDAAEERWTQPPSLDDLPIEARNQPAD
jgi:hypothetical protein